MIVDIRGEDFRFDGRPTYEGVSFRGRGIEGLLFNSRMVQATFDDENPTTRELWAYPDTGAWDPERNTNEFVAAMPSWRAHGLLAVTVDLQGGGAIYDKPFPYDEYVNSACDPSGALKPAYMARLARVLDRARDLGMAVILGLVYFGIDHRYLEGPEAARTLTDNVVDWLAARGDRHVLIEIANERTHIRTRGGNVEAIELMERLRQRSRAAYGDGFVLLCSTSLGGRGMHDDEHLRAMDYVLVHGNGVGPEGHARMIEEIRANPVFAAAPKPIVFNEAHTDASCLAACAELHASWGFFDQGRGNYRDGYQTPPVCWEINTEPKQRFFDLLKGITDGANPEVPPMPPAVHGFDGLPDEPVTGRLRASAAIDDRWGVRPVEFFIDGTRVGEAQSYPYRVGGPEGFDVTALAPGEHTLRAVAASVSGATTTVEARFTVAAR